MSNEQKPATLAKRRAKQEAPKPVWLLNEQAAAEALGLTARTMQSWRHSGSNGPPHVRISSRCVRYRLADLEQFAADRLCASTSDRGSVNSQAK